MNLVMGYAIQGQGQVLGATALGSPALQCLWTHASVLSQFVLGQNIFFYDITPLVDGAIYSGPFGAIKQVEAGEKRLGVGEEKFLCYPLVTLRIGSTPIPTCLPGKVDRESGCGSKWSNQAGLRRPFTSGAFLFPDSIIDRQSIQAYLETDYHVHSDAPMTLNIGVANPSLAALHKARRIESSAFVTACNPFSQAFDESANAERQAALAHELQQRSLTYIEGIGQHPKNGWPGELSFLVLGLSREAAKALGNRHEQNAIVWCGLDAAPELVLLR